ncbi:MAG: hypothetical protein HOB82_05720 [Alphaproteobacteria bacterium]|jgi:hypothetical protein|nr:hypothetical protein [Rhodospirillaceae bacterium]MBT4711007.1 hypothetical protein [Alphaproteobacteria bacterium]
MDDVQIITDMATLKTDVQRLREAQDDIRRQVDSLAAVANLGKGALWASLKIGAFLGALVGGLAVLVQWGRP